MAGQSLDLISKIFQRINEILEKKPDIFSMEMISIFSFLDSAAKTLGRNDTVEAEYFDEEFQKLVKTLNNEQKDEYGERIEWIRNTINAIFNPEQFPEVPVNKRSLFAMKIPALMELSSLFQ